METSWSFEIITLVVLVVVLLVDIVRNCRNPHRPKTTTCALWVLVYGIAAVVFGLILIWRYGHITALEFYSGWLTEYSLSIDNLFVFVVILAKLKVPEQLQKQALGIGILLALVLRGIFIILGGLVVQRFTWIFYFFAAFLLYTSVKLLVKNDEETTDKDNKVVKFLYKVLPLTTEYHGSKIIVTTDNKKRAFTPMLVVFISLGITDLLFAFDSIPAIFGLTHDPFIVFTSNVFALMGLQQLYFVLGNLIEKLEYFPLGLAIVLAFVGIKLLFEALHGSGVEFIPEIHTLPSLMVIIITISLTTIASVIKLQRHKRKSDISSKSTKGES
ncbi:MAG: TerC/Alx family metal homeostasis membrane protein [Candidatus Ancillula sp.]|jgi:tellurite resistance protein TerC|nr:TerC/Alx family metal homeostasis membrane protein [Candidatus Ancillula sp.]